MSSSFVRFSLSEYGGLSTPLTVYVGAPSSQWMLDSVVRFCYKESVFHDTCQHHVVLTGNIFSKTNHVCSYDYLHLM